MLNLKFAKTFIASSFLLFITACVVSYRNTDSVTDQPSSENTDSLSASLPVQKVLLNKHAVRFVADYIRHNTECLNKIKGRSVVPFTMMDNVFKKYRLPVELKYLAVIESELKPSAVSKVGATGPWQLMPETAKTLGLKISENYDERTQYAKSTRAAALYLRDLHNEFDDWLLVLAAYNSGPGPVNNAIQKSGSRNFWVLQYYLPAESREHVKKFIATQYYFEGQGSATTQTKTENLEYVKAVATANAHNPQTKTHKSSPYYAVIIPKI